MSWRHELQQRIDASRNNEHPLDVPDDELPSPDTDDDSAMTHQFTKTDLEELVSNLCFSEFTEQYGQHDESLLVECPTAEDAHEVHEVLLCGFPIETLDVRHYPVTDDEDGTIECYQLRVRRLHYDPHTGWWSSDLPRDPDIEFTPEFDDDPAGSVMTDAFEVDD